MQNFIVRITEENFPVFGGGEMPGCLILPSATDLEKAAVFINQMRKNGALVLIEGEKAPETCRLLNADGIVTAVDSRQPYKKQLAAVRQSLGSGKILGVVCPVERHAAMIVSECEPDFVIFEQSSAEPEKFAELTAWYSELFLIQSAVSVDAADAPLAEWKYDFVVCADKIYKILVAKN